MKSCALFAIANDGKSNRRSRDRRDILHGSRVELSDVPSRGLAKQLLQNLDIDFGDAIAIVRRLRLVIFGFLGPM